MKLSYKWREYLILVTLIIVGITAATSLYEVNQLKKNLKDRWAGKLLTVHQHMMIESYIYERIDRLRITLGLPEDSFWATDKELTEIYVPNTLRSQIK